MLDKNNYISIKDLDESTSKMSANINLLDEYKNISSIDSTQNRKQKIKQMFADSSGKQTFNYSNTKFDHDFLATNNQNQTNKFITPRDANNSSEQNHKDKYNAISQVEKLEVISAQLDSELITNNINIDSTYRVKQNEFESESNNIKTNKTNNNNPQSYALQNTIIANSYYSRKAKAKYYHMFKIGLVKLKQENYFQSFLKTKHDHVIANKYVQILAIESHKCYNIKLKLASSHGHSFRKRFQFKAFSSQCLYSNTVKEKSDFISDLRFKSNASVFIDRLKLVGSRKYFIESNIRECKIKSLERIMRKFFINLNGGTHINKEIASKAIECKANFSQFKFLSTLKKYFYRLKSKYMINQKLSLYYTKILGNKVNDKLFYIKKLLNNTIKKSYYKTIKFKIENLVIPRIKRIGIRALSEVGKKIIKHKRLDFEQKKIQEWFVYKKAMRIWKHQHQLKTKEQQLANFQIDKLIFTKYFYQMKSQQEIIPKFESNHLFWIALFLVNALKIKFNFQQIKSEQSVVFPSIFTLPVSNRSMKKYAEANKKLTRGQKRQIFTAFKKYHMQTKVLQYHIKRSILIGEFKRFTGKMAIKISRKAQESVIQIKYQNRILNESLNIYRSFHKIHRKNKKTQLSIIKVKRDKLLFQTFKSMKEVFQKMFKANVGQAQATTFHSSSLKVKSFLSLRKSLARSKKMKKSQNILKEFKNFNSKLLLLQILRRNQFSQVSCKMQNLLKVDQKILIRNIFKRLRKTAKLSQQLKKQKMEKNKLLMDEAWSIQKQETNFKIRSKTAINIDTSKIQNQMSNVLFRWFKYSSQVSVNRIKISKQFKEKGQHELRFWLKRFQRICSRKKNKRIAKEKVHKLKLFHQLNTPLAVMINTYTTRRLKEKQCTRLTQIQHRYKLFTPFQLMFQNMDTQIKQEHLMDLATSWHQTKIKKRIYEALNQFKNKRELYKEKITQIKVISKKQLLKRSLIKLIHSKTRLDTIKQKLEDITIFHVKNTTIDALKYRFWNSELINRKINKVKKVTRNLWYAELKRRLLLKLIDSKRVRILSTLTDSSCKYSFFKKLHLAAEKVMLRKNAAYAIFSKVETAQVRHKSKLFMNQLYNNYVNYEENIEHGKKVFEGVQITQAFTVFSKRLLNMITRRKKAELLKQATEQQTQSQILKSWKTLYQFKAIQRKTNLVVDKSILKRSFDKLKYAFACSAIVNQALKKQNIKIALKSITSFRNNLIIQNQLKAKHQALSQLKISKLAMETLINWKVKSLDIRKNRKTDQYRSIQVKNKVFNALNKKYRINKFHKSIVEQKNFNELKKTFKQMIVQSKVRLSVKGKLANLIKIASKCVLKKQGKIFYQSLKQQTKHEKIRTIVAGRFLRKFNCLFKATNSILAQKLESIKEIRAKQDQHKKSTAMSRFKQFTIQKQRYTLKNEFFQTRQKREKLLNFLQAVSNQANYKKAFKATMMLSTQQQIYSQLKRWSMFVKYKKLSSLSSHFHKIRVYNSTFNAFKSQKDINAQKHHQVTQIRARLFERVSQPNVDLLYDFIFKWNIHNYELRHNAQHSLKKKWLDSKKKREFEEKVQKQLDTVKRRNLFYQLVDLQNTNQELDNYSDQAALIRLKQTGVGFLSKTRSLLKRKAQAIDTSDRLIKIIDFKEKKKVFQRLIQNKTRSLRNSSRKEESISRIRISREFNKFISQIQHKKSRERLMSTVRSHSNKSTSNAIVKESFRRLKENSENSLGNNKELLKKCLGKWVELLRSKNLYKNQMDNYSEVNESVTASKMEKQVNDTVQSDYDLVKDL